MSLLRRRTDAEAEDRALSRASVPSVMLTTDGGTTTLSPQAALRVADVYAAVRLVAGTVATLPLKTYRRLEGGDRSPFTGALAGLLERPTPTGTQAGLLGQVATHLLTRGNCYLGLFRDADGRVAQLAALPPEQVVVKVEDGEVVFDYLAPSGVARLTGRDVCHVRHPVSDDGVLGLSPLRQAAAAIGMNRALVAHGAAFAENAARPSGLLAVKNLSPSQATEFREQVLMRSTGEKAGGIMVVSADEVEWKPFTLTMSDLEYVESTQLSTAGVARIFGVPPELLGGKAGDSMTYANVESRTIAFRQSALLPLTTAIEQAVSAHPGLSPSNVFAEFVYEGLLRPDSKTRAEVYTAALDPESGWMTRAEVRRLENLDPEPDAPAPREQRARPRTADSAADVLRRALGGPPEVVVNVPEAPAPIIHVAAPEVTVTPDLRAVLDVPSREVEVTEFDNEGRPVRYRETRTGAMP